MIANFVLNGIESAAFVGCSKTQRVDIPSIKHKHPIIKENTEGAVNNSRLFESSKSLQVSRILVRFVDTIIVVMSDKKDIPIVRRNIKAFLDDRGIELNLNKCRLLKWLPGETFDFLGYTFRKVDKVKSKGMLSRRGDLVENRVLIYPKLSKLKKIKHRVRTIIKEAQNLTAAELVIQLNPVIRG